MSGFSSLKFSTLPWVPSTREVKIWLKAPREPRAEAEFRDSRPEAGAVAAGLAPSSLPWPWPVLFDAAFAPRFVSWCGSAVRPQERSPGSWVIPGSGALPAPAAPPHTGQAAEEGARSPRAVLSLWGTLLQWSSDPCSQQTLPRAANGNQMERGASPPPATLLPWARTHWGTGMGWDHWNGLGGHWNGLGGHWNGLGGHWNRLDEPWNGLGGHWSGLGPLGQAGGPLGQPGGALEWAGGPLGRVGGALGQPWLPLCSLHPSWLWEMRSSRARLGSGGLPHGPPDAPCPSRALQHQCGIVPVSPHPPGAW